MSNLPHHLWFAIAGMEVPDEEAPIPAPPAEAVKVAPPVQVCPEVWRTEPINPQRAMDAVHAMCRGGA